MNFAIRSSDLEWDDFVAMSSVMNQAFEGSLVYQPALLRNMAAAGNFVALAESGKAVIGALIAHVALSDKLFLFSGPLATHTEYRKLGVAKALKSHQRFWALERRIDEIVWPFHPRNVSSATVAFSLSGVRCTHIEPDYYGPAPDGSRLFASWNLQSEEAPPPVVKWVPLDGRSDSELVVELCENLDAGLSVVTIKAGRYGLA